MIWYFPERVHLIWSECALLTFIVTLYDFFQLRESVHILPVLFVSLFVNLDVDVVFEFGNISFQIVSALSDTKPVFHRENIKECYKYKVLHNLFSVIAPCCVLFHFLRCTHIIHNTPLYILENTNQDKVSETDHAVTQKLTQPFLLLSVSFLSIFRG